MDSTEHPVTFVISQGTNTQMSFCCGCSLSFRIIWGIQSHSIYREAVICTMPLKCARVYERQRCVSRGKIFTPHHEDFRFAGYPRECGRRCFRICASWILPRLGYSGISGSLHSSGVSFLPPFQANLFSHLRSPRTGSCSWLGTVAQLFFPTFNTDWAGWLSQLRLTPETP